MNPALLIDFKDRATPELNRQLAALAPEKVAAKTGPRAREFTVEHLRNNPRNKRAWPSTGFWEDAARATIWVVDAEGGDAKLRIRIDKIGVTQRFYGGTITAVNVDMLTIPIASQAYGKSARNFPGAFLIRTPKGAYIVQYSGSVGKRGRMNKHSATLEFLFKLKRSVTQKANRNIIPSEAAYSAVCLKAVEAYFARVKTGGAK